MPVEAQTVEVADVGDGVTVSFAFPFKFLSASDLVVGLDGQEQMSGFSVSGAGADTGGTVTFSSPPAAGVRVSIIRKPPASQLIDFVNGQTVLEGILDNGLDKLTMIVQYLLRGVSRSVRLGDLDPSADGSLTIPSTLARASKLMGFDASGNVIAVAPNPAGNGTISAANIVDGTPAGRDILTSTLGRIAASSLAAAAALVVAAGVNEIQLLGRAAANDGGGGTYVRLAAAPPVAKPWHFSTNGGTVWWELRAFPVLPKQVGAVLDGVTDEPSAIQAWVDYAAAMGVPACGQPGTALIVNSTVVLPSNVVIKDTSGMIIRRTGDTPEPLMAGANAVVEGVNFDYAAGTNSTSAIDFTATGKVFTVAAGRGFVAGQFVVCRPTANPTMYMLASVVSYVGSTLTLDAPSTLSGTGSFSSWYIQTYTNSTGGGNTPAAIRLTAATSAEVAYVKTTGRFFVAIGLLNCSGATVSRCRLSGFSDRGVENNTTSGVRTGNSITDNVLDGLSWGFYGINSAVTGNSSAIAQYDLTVSGNRVKGVRSQGVSAGGNIQRVSIANNRIAMVGQVDGVGVLVQALDSQQPSLVIVSGNTVSLGIYGILMLNTWFSSVQGNAVEYSGTNGIRWQSTGTFTSGLSSCVSNNTIRQVVGDGICLFNVATAPLLGVAVTGNSTYGCGGWGILTTSSTSQCVITGNSNLGNTGGAISPGGTGHVVANNG